MQKTVNEVGKILWFENSKAQGFERFPIFFGGMERRFMYVQEVLGKYINQEIDKIEELEEEVLCGINTSWKEAPAYLGV